MIDQLLRLIADFHRARTDPADFPMIVEVLDALDHAKVATAPTPDPKPVVRHLSAIDTGSTDEHADAIVAEFLAVADELPWSQTAGYLDVLPQDYLDNYGYVRLVGPDSIVEHDAVRVGIGLWGPRLDYPLHEHPAEELYHVLYGQPEFRTDATEFAVRGVGDAVHHPPWMKHAQRFGASPTLLLYAWTGEILPDARFTSGQP